MSDEHLRRLLRAARAGDQSARRALEREKRRRGLPSRAGALKLWRRAQSIAVIEIPAWWVAELRESHPYVDAVDLLEVATNRWRDETVFADLYRGSESTYVRVERHLAERYDQEDDADSSGDVILENGDLYDGAVVRHPPIRYGGVIVRPARRSVIRLVPVASDDEEPPGCECDNTHQAVNTVCRWCWNRGRRQWSDPEVAS